MDANVMVAMQFERLKEEEGAATTALNEIVAKSYFVIDAEEQCLQEWMDTLPGPFGEEVKAWLTQLQNDGKLEVRAQTSCADIIRKCRLAGLPKKDQKWIKLCRDGCIHFFVTEDIDFYNPALKRASVSAKEKAKRSSNAPMRKLVEKELAIKIVTIEQLPDWLA